MPDPLPPLSWAHIPVEIKARELEAKALLALALVERGWGVTLGGQAQLHTALPNLPTGVYLSKGVVPKRAPFFARLRDQGHRIAAWCEEGLVYRHRQAYLDSRIDAEALLQAERFFAWGETQARDILDKVPAASDRVLVTGNHRVDLLRPELRAHHRERVEQIRREHGRFLLVNTNFSRFNHYCGPDFILPTLRQAGKITTDEQEAFYTRWIDFAKRMYESFVTLLPALSHALPGSTIVVRPHPSENHDAWRAHADPLPNVRVIYEDGAIPWLLASSAVLHNSCTTGLEAYLLDRPVFAYRPFTSEEFDSPLPNAVSVCAPTAEDLVAHVRQALRDPDAHAPADPDRRALVASYLTGLEGPLACQRIANALAGLDVPPVPYAPPGPGERLRRSTLPRLRARATEAIRRVARRRSGLLQYQQQKFPHLSRKELRALLGGLATATGLPQAVRVDPIGDALYALTPAP
ncbi:MAG: surface carbohydrate biosynthesis protein [Planctomycetota bacterium]